ncbi:unnamed protein product [Withania somnifera]
MENGEEVVGTTRIEERNGVVDKIVEVRLEDKVAVISDVSKEPEGDEVFEEAIELETPDVSVEDGVVGEERTDGNSGNVNCSYEDSRSSQSSEDVENFEEAVEALHEVQHADDESNQKADVNLKQEPSVEKPSFHEIELMDETKAVEQNIIAEKGKDDMTEVADLGAAIKTETLVKKPSFHEIESMDETKAVEQNIIAEKGKDDMTEVSVLGAAIENETSVNLEENEDKSGEPAEFENGVFDHGNMEESQSHDDAKETIPDLQDQEVRGKLDAQDANEAKGGNSVLQNQPHPYKDALLHDKKNVHVIETSAVQPAGHQDTADMHIDASVSSGAVLNDEGVHSLHLNPLKSDVMVEEQKDISPNDASTNGHLRESLNPSDELKEEARGSPERTNVYNMNKEQIDVDRTIDKTMCSPVPVNGSKKDEEQQIDGVKAVHSPEPVSGCNKDEEQQIDGVKAVNSPEPVNASNKDEEQQIDGITAMRSPEPVNGSNKDEEQQIDGVKAVHSPEPVNGSNKDEQDGPGNLKLNESSTMGPGNLNDRTNEQKNVSVSGTSSSENHTGISARGGITGDDEMSKSSETLPPDNHVKVKVSQDAGVGDKGLKQVVKSVVAEDLKQSVPKVREPEARSSTEPSSSGASAGRTQAPAGLGRAAPLLEPAPRAVQQQPRVNGTAPPAQNQLVEESTNGEADEYDETREKLQMIRVKFLRLAHRNGQTPHNVVVAQVLSGGRVGAFSFDRASAMAEQLEATGQEPLDFSCTIMVLGKTGVGKSATINSIFDEVKLGTDAFQIGTKKVQDVVGTVQGIKVRVIDTPGLLPSWSDQRQNEKILHSVKRFIKKTPPDIVLYLDRLDMQSRDNGDMPLLRTITEIFGPSIWFNAIVVLTHAASAPPEGPNGTVTSYDMFVTQRSHVVQQAIRQAAGDMRLMNPVSLVENHSACRTNRAGQRVLPNGQPPGQPYATRTRSPPLPFLLSSLLQSRPQVKLPEEQFDDDDEALGDDTDESSESEDESEYDQLPPFKRLTKAQLAKLSKEQKKAYNDELEHREKLFMKKQLKEGRKRRKMLKKMQAAAENLPPTDSSENVDEETGGAASVPVPMPDLALPASFDSDNPTHRYRYLDSSNQWLVRPVLEPNGWDHDVGYEGINVERLFVVKDKIPISLSSQISKDKKDANLQMEVASSVKHGNGKATSLGFDMQSVGKDLAYTLRSETRFCNYRKNKATAGLSVTLLGDVMTGGLKVEDKLTFNRRGSLVVSGGAMFGRGDVAYGGSLEATLRDKDHPLGRFLSTLGLSVMDWHGDLAIGCNSQTQIPIGRYTNLIGRVNINNKGSGQVSIRLNSSEQLQIALISLIPLFRKLLNYSQPAQF